MPAGERSTASPGIASSAARYMASSNAVFTSTGTAPPSCSDTNAAASPYATTVRHRSLSNGASAVYGSPLWRPPRISTKGRAIAWRATLAADTLVALESLIHRTSLIVRTGSSRCGGGRKLARAAAISVGFAPTAAAASTAARALATLWSPKSGNSDLGRSARPPSISASRSRSNQPSLRARRLQCRCDPGAPWASSSTAASSPFKTHTESSVAFWNSSRLSA